MSNTIMDYQKLQDQLDIVLAIYAEAESLYFQYGSAPEGVRYVRSELQEYGLYEQYEKAVADAEEWLEENND